MLPQTQVTFETSDPSLQRLYDAAVENCRSNLTMFGPDRVLVEGGGYEKIWLETQPMGGEMYAPYDMEAALNNQLLFMRTQRQDGRLAGSIQCHPDGRIEPQFNKLQGFCFPWPALNMYYRIGRDADYLRMLERALEGFDGWLHRTRAVSGDGCLSSFCVYDTGEDNALRYGDAPNYCETDAPPEGSSVVPMASMDITSFSYAARDTLARISRIRGDAAGEKRWRAGAEEVAKALRTRLWDEARGACFDRDRQGRTIPVLCHNTLRCMYWGSLWQGMADRFVREHLLNPAEFWTKLPLPSVAANDPAFCNAPENNWSGQCEGLTYQRAILALERYGYEPIVTKLGHKLMEAVIAGGYVFTQQFDPFTARPSRVGMYSHEVLKPGDPEAFQDSYGPTLLSVLGYISHIWGIDQQMGQWWFSLGSGPAYAYALSQGEHEMRIDSDGKQARILMDGREIHCGPGGVRIITNDQGQILGIRRIEE
ncbi:MAG: hypothetical protein IJA77_04810 [Clostridia bacterium]|nr:hypothetical protein [Clostridia bacterium]